MPPNIGEKREGQERQKGASDVNGRARSVSFPPIIDEKKGKYGTLMEQSMLFPPHQGENGRQWKNHRSMFHWKRSIGERKGWIWTALDGKFGTVLILASIVYTHVVIETRRPAWMSEQKWRTTIYVFLYLSRHGEHAVRNRHQHRAGDGGLAGSEKTQGKSSGHQHFPFFTLILLPKWREPPRWC